MSVTRRFQRVFASSLRFRQLRFLQKEFRVVAVVSWSKKFENRDLSPGEVLNFGGAIFRPGSEADFDVD